MLDPKNRNAVHIEVNGQAATVENLVIAGWTGRDANALEAHILELEALGVPRPKATPTFYRVAASLLTQVPQIQVVGTESSGEAEPVLVNFGGQLMLGLGSDHTDRKVEAYDVAVSKQACAKPLAKAFWPLEEVAGHWDDIVLRSFVDEDGEQVLYQEGALAAIRAPDDLLARYSAHTAGLQAGDAMFCGTLAVIGEVRPSSTFTIELADGVLGRAIRHTYAVEALPLA